MAGEVGGSILSISLIICYLLPCFDNVWPALIKQFFYDPAYAQAFVSYFHGIFLFAWQKNSMRK